MAHVEMEHLLVQEHEDTLALALDQYQDNRTWRYIEDILKINIIKVPRALI